MSKLNNPENMLRKKGQVTDFNIMVSGATGIGKSSFVDLFIKKFKLKETREMIKESQNHKNGLSLSSSLTGRIEQYEEYIIKNPTSGFEEKNIRSMKNDFTLRMIDSPGYGNTEELSEWRQMLMDNIQDRFEEYYNEK